MPWCHHLAITKQLSSHHKQQEKRSLIKEDCTIGGGRGIYLHDVDSSHTEGEGEGGGGSTGEIPPKMFYVLAPPPKCMTTQLWMMPT